MPESVTINIKDIIQKKELPTIANFDALLEHIEKRKTYFLVTLAMNKLKSPLTTGWQKISKDQNSLIKKEPLRAPSQDGVFTAALLCRYACLTLAEALKTLITANNLKVKIEVGSFQTGFAAENELSIPEDLNFHTILRLTDLKSARQVNVDATYAQVNHRLTGQIVQFDKTKFKKMYPSSSDEEPDFFEFSSRLFEGFVLENPSEDPQDAAKLLATLL